MLTLVVGVTVGGTHGFEGIVETPGVQIHRRRNILHRRRARMAATQLVDALHDGRGVIGTLEKADDLAARAAATVRIHDQKQILTDCGTVIATRFFQLRQLSCKQRVASDGVAPLPIQLNGQIDVAMAAHENSRHAIAHLVLGAGGNDFLQHRQRLGLAFHGQQVRSELTHLGELHVAWVALDATSEKRDELRVAALDAIQVQQRLFDALVLRKLLQQLFTETHGAGTIPLALEATELEHAEVQALGLLG